MITTKLQILKIFFWVTGILLFFWWPLSHWFYSDWYHQILGFEQGSYQESMVKVIGTIGLVPVLLLLFSAHDPIRNKQMVFTLLIFCVSMSLTYIHLILNGSFPKLELINVILLLVASIIIMILYPWKIEKGKPI
jgi:uncharacterized membrane protein